MEVVEKTGSNSESAVPAGEALKLICHSKKSAWGELEF